MGGEREEADREMYGLPPPTPPAAEIGASQDNDVGAASVFVKMPPRYDGQS
jgi:hypothetical protein